MVSSSLFFPPLTPPALSRPAGRKRELTAVFGRVFEQGQYTLNGTLGFLVRDAAQASFAALLYDERKTRFSI